MNNSYDVAVIGLGAMGTAACAALASRGVRVLGLEQFGIPTSLGSSHGETRMIRLCYFEHPDYVPLLHRAYELWHELEHRTGQRLLYLTGGIYMGESDGTFIRGTLGAAQAHRLPHEILSHEDLRQRFSQFVLPQEYVGVFEPNAGFLLPERTVATHAALALECGAELRGQEPVLDWQTHRDSVTLRTTNNTYSAARLIICGGAWSQKIVGTLGVKLTVTRQALGWVWPRTPRRFQLGVMPVWAIDHPDGTQHYGFPMLAPNISARPGFKIAHHFHGTPTTAETIDRQAHAEDEHDFRPILERHIPDANGPLLSMLICMYTNTPDSHFIIDRHPEHQQVIIACGFSGHGFKFASVMGEALADLAVQGSTRHPIGFLGLKRFENSSQGR
jgi:sarcosine oxidase